MSVFAPTTAPQVAHLFGPRAATTSSASRRQETPVSNREALRREAERVARRRAHAERARDNAAARHPLALR